MTYLPSEPTPFALAPPAPSPVPPVKRSIWTPWILTQLVVTLVVLASGVVGAGVLRGRTDSTDVLSLVQAASTTAESVKTFRATMDMDMSVNGRHLNLTGEALLDTATQRQSGFFEAPGLGRISVVQVGTRAYFQLPSGRADGNGHHWLAVTAPEGAAQSAVGGQDPTAWFRFLADPEDVKEVGSDTVNGVEATHYRIKPDPQRLVDLSSKALGTALPPGAAESVKNLHFDVWIDGDKRVRRMRMELKQEPVTMKMTMNVLDFGRAFTVSEPAASDVTDVQTIAGLGPAFVSALSGSHG